MRYKSSVNIQKLYDDSYRICSTAVYFESRDNEEEALRCWKDALSKIRTGTRAGNTRAGNTGRRSSQQTLSETEKSLVESLNVLEARCQDRVDLLETLKLSRDEEEQSRNVITAWNGGEPLHSSSSPLRGPREQPQQHQHQHQHQQRRSRRPVITPDRPPHDPVSPGSSPSPGRGLLREPLPPNVIVQPKVNPRTPSPEKKGFLTTLRPNGQAAKRPSKGSHVGGNKAHGLAAANAAKAASRAWSSTSRLDNPWGEMGVQNASSSDVNSFLGRPDSASNSATDLRLHTSSSYSPSSSTPYNPPYPLDVDSDPIPVSQSQERRRSRRDFSTDFDYFAEAVPAYTYSSHTEYPPPRPPKMPLASQSSKPEFNIPSYHGYKERLPAEMLQSRFSNMKIQDQEPRKSDEFDDLYNDPGNASNSFGSPSPNSRKEARGAERPMEPTSRGSISMPPPPPAKDDREGDESLADDAILNNRFKKALEDLGSKIDAEFAQRIINEIILHGDEVRWDDIAGLDTAKLALKEAVVYPFLRPDLFSGLREPQRGVLLYGPPGTGKTMLAKAVATESKSTFFAISASSLTSKYLGESEKLVRTLFTLAKALAPAIIFVDEIDSLLSNRSSNSDTEATTRIKTEFLIQWNDLSRAAAGRKVEPGCGEPSRVLVLAATNVPWAIDEAARRRFVKRQYIPLPEGPVRVKQLKTLLGHQKHAISDDDLEYLESLTEGFSGSDITALAKDAAMGPLRSLGEALLHMHMDQIRPIELQDFVASLKSIRPSVSKEGLKRFEDWTVQYGERV